MSKKHQFGLTIVEKNADTTLSKQIISKLKSIDNAIFDSANFIDKEKIEIKYRLFKPTQKRNKKTPLVIVFHGSGAIGTDNKSQLGLLLKLFASPEIQKKYPSYILAPQFPTRSSDYVMDNTKQVLTSSPRPCLNTVLQLIDSLRTTFNIDKKRIYVIGFSMGGSTAINALAARPEMFAAGISIAGIPQFDQIEALKNIPIWLIHGIDDTENSIKSDEQFYKDLGTHVRFWKLKAINHDDIFTSKIVGETLPKWLFNQRKK